MSAHIIGRPNDDLLDIMLGHGDAADPEQEFIRGSKRRDARPAPAGLAGDPREDTPQNAEDGKWGI
jgi:hypothetical protein